MKNKAIFIIIMALLTIFVFSGCSEPKNSANGDNLTPGAITLNLE